MVTNFFLGANSGGGFRDLFTPFCEPKDFRDLILLKGGPGVGKSTLMGRIGRAMEEREEDVVYFHCSGDPDSLDGVWFPGLRVAVLDATSPHVCEPRYPAAVDRYVNLGEFYDITRAKEQRGEIVGHTDACSAAYARAYLALGADRGQKRGLKSSVGEGLDREKLLSRREGIISRESRGRGAGGGVRRFFLGSLTCRGAVWRFDTVQAMCPRVYQLQDSWALAAPMLERLCQAALSRDYSCLVCPAPEEPGRIEHLLLPELELAFVTSREGMVYTGPGEEAKWCPDRSGSRKGTVMDIFPPFLCLSSVVCPGALALACHGIDAVPAAPLFGVQFLLLLFRQLFVGDEFFHNSTPFLCDMKYSRGARRFQREAGKQIVNSVP